MKFVRIVYIMISVLFTAIAGFLGIASLFVHDAVNFETYEEKVAVVSRNPGMALMETAVLLAVILAVSGLVYYRTGNNSRAERTRLVILTSAAAALTVAEGLFWIRENPYPPYADQKKVWDAAAAIAEGRTGDIDVAYFWIYPFQKNMVMVLWIIARIFGTNPVTSIRMVNVVCAALIVVGIHALCLRMLTGRKSSVAGIVLCVLFLPIVIYTCFVYGTLMSAAACIWAFYGAVRLNETGRIRYGILPLILIPFANVCYSGTLIALIAAEIFLLAPAFAGLCRRNQKKKVAAHNPAARIVLCLFIPVLSAVSLRGAGMWFNMATGIPQGDNMPAAQYIYMGLTSTEEEAAAGPGSFVTSDSAWNGSNAEEVNRSYQEKIRTVLSEYVHHGRSYRFFLRKTFYQWMDPWFSSLTMTASLWMKDYEMPALLANILTGKPVRWMQHLLTIVLSTVYLMSAWCGINVIRALAAGKKAGAATVEAAGAAIVEAAGAATVGAAGVALVDGAGAVPVDGARQETERKGAASVYFPAELLLEIYFIGGFVFQLFWESKARYCFPYFLCLLPLAAEGTGSIYVYCLQRLRK